MSGGIVVSSLSKALICKMEPLLREGAPLIGKRELSELQVMVWDLRRNSEFSLDAERKAGQSSVVRHWLECLQYMLYEVNDLIDELQIMLNRVSSSRSRHFVPTNFLQKSRLASTIKSLREALAGVRMDAELCGLVRMSIQGVEEPLRRGIETCSFVDPRDVVGRDRDEHQVLRLILTSDDHQFSVVPILGSLAIGKTTLAQLIYNNDKVRQSFDCRLWLSLEGCQDTKSFLIMLTSCLGERNLEWSIDQLQMYACKMLHSERVFIVLDDLEDDDLHRSMTRELRELTKSSVRGSVIMVTTRSRVAARSIGTTPAYQLHPLSPRKSYQLFARCAFGPSSKERPLELHYIGSELVKLCGGVPLLLKVVGSLLSMNDTVNEWRRFLEVVRERGFANIREDMQFNSDDNFRIPACLAYPLQCFRLQKACGLGVEALTCVWMALGFCYPQSQHATTSQPHEEDIAKEYLNEIADCSLCPHVEYAPGGVIRHIKFYDALYDLATMSGNQWWHVVRDENQFGGSPMYVIWDRDCPEETLLPSHHIRYPNKVRLFFIRARRQASLQFLRDVVSCFQSLRVLGLGRCNVEMLPASIDNLKHLRYLDVGRNPSMKSLPDAICKLWHLQTLFLHGCSNLQELPAKIGRLQNLRHLTLTILLNVLPDALGQLTSLRTFGLTNCPRLTSLPSSIQNLKSLEKLAIVKCPELDLASTSSVEAFKGMDSMHTLLLSHLPKFTSLSSELENLKATLKHLQILSCSGLAEAKWITQFRSLNSLTIEECPGLLDLTLTDGGSQLTLLSELIIGSCESLGYTAWIRQFVSLHTLIIDDCPIMVVLDDDFYELKSLRKLQIRGCPGFTEWFASPEGKNWYQNIDVEVMEVDGKDLKPGFC